MSISYGGDSIQFADGTNIASGRTGFVNKIINGDCRIDQRNAGASVTPTDNQYTLDRWTARLTQASKYTVQQNAGSVTPPVGFNNYLGVTSLSAYSVGAGDTFDIQQRIEGFNTADFGWGTVNAKTVTLSFWVRSSLTGTFGGVLQNSAFNRSYPFSYTISSANTWTQISVTIAGDTTGTWVGATNGTGIVVSFGLGNGSNYSGTAGAWAAAGLLNCTGATSVVGTNGATFYITGVDLRAGTYTTAPTWEFRSIGQELALCQRYCYTQTGGIGDRVGFGYCGTTTLYNLVLPIPVTMRSAPTLSSCSPVTVNDNQAGYNSSSITIGDQVTSTAVNLKVTSSGMTIGRGAQAYWTSGSSNLMVLSAEL